MTKNHAKHGSDESSRRDRQDPLVPPEGGEIMDDRKPSDQGPNKGSRRDRRNPLMPTEGDDSFMGHDRGNRWNGGLGNDTLRGGRGKDHLSGDRGNDILRGEFMNDVLNGGDGDDQLLGGVGNDNLLGGLGNDLILGEVGKDVLSGEDGNDTLNGGQGKDILNGGIGSDLLMGGNSNDMLVGSAIVSVNSSTSDPTASPTTPSGEVDTLIGGGGRDTFVVGVAGEAGAAASALYGTGGDLDYAMIVDFRVPDVIQLAGAATSYVAQAATVGSNSGTGIYLNSSTGQAPDLVALLVGVDAATVNLSSGAFTYIA